MTVHAPETLFVESRVLTCDGDGGALGHPRVALRMDARDMVECAYCDRRYILIGGQSDTRADARANKNS